MALYELRLTPSPYRSLYNPKPDMTAQAVVDALVGSRVQALTPFGDGYLLAVDVSRGDHSQALNELSSAASTFGFDVAEAAFTEFVYSLWEGAAAGAAGGAALGAATRSGEGFLFLLFAGLIVGTLAGSTHKTVRARYSAHRLYTGDWRFFRQDLPPTAQAQPA